MARPLADPLYERLLRSFPATQAYTRTDWDDDAMPAPVAHFLEQLLNHHSRREARRLRRARTRWVDYDHPKMEAAVRTFFDAVESHTRVPADEWEEVLRQATHHTTSHLVRPVHVLTDFVYAERENELRLAKILRRMNFFGPYKYLREAVQAFAKKHNIDVLGPDRFQRFLHRIDERITDDYDAEQWVRLLDPLFVVAHRATGHKQVPAELLQVFFAEKRQKGVEWELEAHADDHESVTPQALRRLIRGEQTTTEETAPPASEAASSPQEADPDRASSDETVWGVAGTARPEGTSGPAPSDESDDDASVPLWKRFQGQQARPSDQGRSETNGTSEGGTQKASSPDRPEDDDTQEPLWSRFQHERDERLSDAVSDEASTPDESPSRAEAATPDSVQDSTSAATSPDTASVAPSPSEPSTSAPSPSDASAELEALERRALGGTNDSDRSVYVRQLFGGSESDYRQVLRRLAEADSWGEASQIIAGDIFRTHKVNIYSDAAVHFTNAVEARFRNE